MSAALDPQRVFVWTNSTRIGGFDLASGAALWDEPNDGSQAVGAPVVAGNILFAATDASLVARDAPTGAILWRVALSEKPTGGPFVEGPHVLVPYEGEHAWRSVVDGAFVRREPATHESDQWVIPDDVGRPVTPRVAMKGRVYFGTEKGAIVCLGASQP
jgi:outer membrane protein assembly factor BamB